MNRLFDRLPDRQSTLSVYAFAVFIVYSWTLFTSFWKIPSWIYYLKLSDLIAIYSYSFLVNFIESGILLGISILLCLVLPQKFWKKGFVSKSVAFIGTLMGSIFYRIIQFIDPNLRREFVSGQQKWILITLTLIIIVILITSCVEWIRIRIEHISERFIVFLYLYLPLTAIALFVIIIRVIV